MKDILKPGESRQQILDIRRAKRPANSIVDNKMPGTKGKKDLVPESFVVAKPKRKISIVLILFFLFIFIVLVAIGIYFYKPSILGFVQKPATNASNTSEIDQFKSNLDSLDKSIDDANNNSNNSETPQVDLNVTM